MKKNKSLDEKRLQKELEIIKRELEELKVKLELSQKTDISKLPLDAVRKVGETTSEVVKSATDMVDKAVKVAQSVTRSAYKGSKKSLKEE